MAHAADGTLARAQDSQKAAQELTAIASQLGSLMCQFKIERSDRRFNMSVPVTLIAADVDGRTLEQEVMTVDVSKRGVQVKGVRGKLRTGSQVSLVRLNKREQFQVAWVGVENSARTGQIGLAAINPATSFWGDLVESHSEVALAA